MRKAIERNAATFAAIVGLVAIATPMAFYIVRHERLRLPFVDPAPFRLEAEFSRGEAVLAGQGQSVRVAGVRIGEIAGVRLEQGHAVVSMNVSPRYRWLIRRDAHALMRPRSGLKDMFVELDPGSRTAPRAPDGFRIPLADTLPDVNFDELIAPLDTDTRDYFKLMVSGLGEGLHGRAPDLRAILARFGPTHRDLARIAGALAVRRERVRRLVHDLSLLTARMNANASDLAGLVRSSEAALRSVSDERVALGDSLSQLPGTLRQATGTLGELERFARLLGPTSADLVPAARRLAPATGAVRTLARRATPVFADQLRPFARDARPAVRELAGASRGLAASTPDLTRDFQALDHLFNLLGYNPGGRQGPDVAARDEGFLFWVAWATHHADNAWGVTDAHGPLHNTIITASCTALRGLVEAEPAREYLDNLTGVLSDPNLCAR